MPARRWTIEIIKAGIERFAHENGQFPTAWDFDRSPYLPSARQVQRAFGGLEQLRLQLGIIELNYTKGELRSTRSLEGSLRGTKAEDELEVLLIKKFGEPFVHTQKRYYKDHRNRYDFFIYYKNGYVGVDIFTTARTEYIGPNIRHKIPKYRNVPNDTPIWFVVDAPTLNDSDIRNGALTARELERMPNIHVGSLSQFLAYIKGLEPLDPPRYIKTVIHDIEHN